MRTAAAPAPAVEIRIARGEPTPLEEAEAWSRRWGRLAAFLLLAGFLWPLQKHSLFAGEAVVVWPWSFWGTGDPVLWMALAPADPSGSWVSWSLLPLLAAAAVFAVLRLLALPALGAALLAVGAAALFLLQHLFAEESAAYGLLLPASEAGVQVGLTVLLAASGLVASANHLRRTFTVHPLPRWLSGAGGAVLLAIFLLPLADGAPIAAIAIDAGAWRTAWAIPLVVLGLLLYGAGGLALAFRLVPSPGHLAWMSAAPRLFLAGLPLAYLVSRRALGGGFLDQVMEGGGGAFAASMGLIKCCATHYGTVLLVFAGLTGWLAAVMWRRSAPTALLDEEPSGA